MAALPGATLQEGGEKKQAVIEGEPVPPSPGSQPRPALQGDAGMPWVAWLWAPPSLQDNSSPQTPGAVGYVSLVLTDPPQPGASSLGPLAPGHGSPPALSSQPVVLMPHCLLPQQPQDPPSTSVPSSRPALCQDRRQRRPQQLCGGCRAAGKGREKQGKGSRRGACVCARGGVCVHILTEGLSPRLAGPRGEKEGAT